MDINTGWLAGRAEENHTKQINEQQHQRRRKKAFLTCKLINISLYVSLSDPHTDAVCTWFVHRYIGHSYHKIQLNWYATKGRRRDDKGKFLFVFSEEKKLVQYLNDFVDISIAWITPKIMHQT